MTFPGLFWFFWPSKNPHGTPLGGSNFFSWEWVSYLPEHVCQIWLRSDGLVEKKGGYRQTDKGTLQLYIVEGKVEGQRTRGRPKRPWEKDVEDRMGTNVWRVDEQQKIGWCIEDHQSRNFRKKIFYKRKWRQKECFRTRDIMATS